MFSNFKTIVSTAILMMFVSALIPAQAANVRPAAAPKVVNPVKVIGKTADGKYNVYDLDGDLNDINYRTSNSILFQPDDLPARMQYLSFKDAKSGAYACDFICKDKAGHTVGLSPDYAKMYGKLQAVPK